MAGNINYRSKYSSCYYFIHIYTIWTILKLGRTAACNVIKCSVLICVCVCAWLLTKSKQTYGPKQGRVLCFDEKGSRSAYFDEYVFYYYFFLIHRYQICSLVTFFSYCNGAHHWYMDRTLLWLHWGRKTQKGRKLSHVMIFSCQITIAQNKIVLKSMNSNLFFYWIHALLN